MLQPGLPLRLSLACDDDLDFFKCLYATTRDELKALGLSAAQYAELMASQQQIQEHGLRMTYPDAQQWTILLESTQAEKIGRLILDFTNNDWRVVDIAILPEFRNQGWGTQLMRSLMSKASQTQASVSLGVMSFNQGARRLYDSLGFSLIRQDGIHAQMIWRSPALAEP